jgi:hypothetical protein
MNVKLSNKNLKLLEEMFIKWPSNKLEADSYKDN